MNVRALLVATMIGSLAACAANPVPQVRRDADLERLPGAVTGSSAAKVQALDDDQSTDRLQPEIRRGSQAPLRDIAPANGNTAPSPRQRGSTGFNFQGVPIQIVIAAILGDMLGQKYAISTGVQGTVTLNTPKPVTHAEALQLLETVLSWNNARMIYSGGRYNIVPADQALNSGMVSPRGSTAAYGYQVRPERLRYVSANEMKKILEPYARPNAIVSVDSMRNIITLAGTPAELANYERTIQTFDIDWMASMSVGVYPLQSGNAAKVVTDLERVFGEQSHTPGAGMFRFMPLESANAVMVIAAQPNQLDRIQTWIDRLDGGGGGGSRLYTQELRYISARDLAQRLAEVFGGGNNQNGQVPTSSLMPGLQSTQIGDSAMDTATSSAPITGTNGASSGGAPIGQMTLPQRNGGAASASFKVGRDDVGVSAVDENNALLVRASPAAWKSIREVIEKLDVMPLQVHIEAQVVEVKLTGDLKYGVNWYFGNLIADPVLRAAATARNAMAVVGGSNEGDGNGLVLNYVGGNSVAVINALDKVTDVHLLQTPSVIVRNNTEATLNVGSRIPIASVTVNPGTGSSTNTYSQVQYMDTGTILKVRPRVTRDGMVFLDLVQEVSSPGSVADAYGNVRIDTRRLRTEAAVQSGDTVMLAGLISDGVTHGSSGIPGLSRIPVIGGLFGTKQQLAERSEIIILLTPTLIRDPMEARKLTDEYGQKFRGMDPIRNQRKQTH
ncbi:type II secretion system secretin GspD [Lysobacter silvestris]